MNGTVHTQKIEDLSSGFQILLIPLTRILLKFPPSPLVLILSVSFLLIFDVTVTWRHLGMFSKSGILAFPIKLPIELLGLLKSSPISISTANMCHTKCQFWSDGGDREKNMTPIKLKTYWAYCYIFELKTPYIFLDMSFHLDLNFNCIFESFFIAIIFI